MRRTFWPEPWPAASGRCAGSVRAVSRNPQEHSTVSLLDFIPIKLSASRLLMQYKLCVQLCGAVIMRLDNGELWD
jgi:hypothetical protein